MAGGVDDLEARHLIALGECAVDGVGWTLPELADQPVDDDVLAANAILNVIVAFVMLVRL